MLLQDKVLLLIEQDETQLKIEHSNKKELVLKFYNNIHQKFFKFSTIYDGNIMYMQKDSFPTYYEKLFNAANKDMYDKILKAYNNNIEFLNKYKIEINKIKYIEVTIEDPFFYYNKRSEILYAIPNIKLRSTTALFYIELPPKSLSKIEVVVEKIYDDFYWHVFHGLLTKPLNKYTPEELVVFEMIRI